MNMGDTRLSRASVPNHSRANGVSDDSDLHGRLASVRDLYAGRVFPQQQIYTFSHIDQLFPSRIIERGPTVAPLVAGTSQLEELRMQCGHRAYDLYDILSLNRVAAILVLKDGKICLEHYEFGLDRASRWMSMSVAKSIGSTLVGIAIAEGLIDSVDDTLETYLPSLRGGAYEGVSIRQLLQMSSGVEWDEEPTNPASHRSTMLELQLAQQPGAILKYLSGLRRIAAPGTRWNYSTGETHLVGELLRAATGEYLSTFASSRLWSPLGMESDASWWLESPDGLEVAGSGISATLRDYARFGLFTMQGGVLDGRRIVPVDWFTEATSPQLINGERVDYGYQWWPVYDLEDSAEVTQAANGSHAAPGVKKPTSSHPHWHGAFMAAGLFGQHIYVHPQERVVIALWSAQSKPLDGEVVDERAFFNAVVRQLKQ